MIETKYEIETYYSSRKILEKIKEKNTGFITEVFEEDQEFTLNRGYIKLFCKVVSTNNQVVIKVDAIDSNTAPNQTIQKVATGFQMLQASLYISVLMVFLSFFSTVLMVFVGLFIFALIGVLYYLDQRKTKKGNLDPQKTIEEQSIDQLLRLVNGEIIE